MGTEIVNWEEKLRNEAKAVAKTERANVSKISFRGGIMALGDKEIPGNSLDCIVIGYIHENMFFNEPYQQDVVKAPTCFAYSRTGLDMVPHEVVKEPQNPTCDGCWANQWATSGMLSRDGTPNGRKGKACGAGRRKLAVIPLYKDVADVERAEIAIVSVPIMSIKNWSNYVNALSATPAIQRAPWGVATKMSVKPDRVAQFLVSFDFLHNLSDEFLAPVYGKVDLAYSILEQPYDMTPGAYDKPATPPPADNGKKKKY